MTAFVTLYARPVIVRGQPCTSLLPGADPRDDDAERSNPRSASNPPATKPRLATASTVSLRCHPSAEQRRYGVPRGGTVGCERLARQWHARGQNSISSASCDLRTARYEGARPGLASFFHAVPHSRRARMLEPTAEQDQAHPARLRQLGGGLRRTNPRHPRLHPLGEKPSEV